MIAGELAGEPANCPGFRRTGELAGKPANCPGFRR